MGQRAKGLPDKIDSVGRECNLRVLFFEDSVDDVALCLRVLRASNFLVEHDVAVTLAEFYRYLRAGSYDVVLSDYHMPGVTGMDCFAVLKAERPNIPFILVTGSLGDERAVECLNQGVAYYVLKDRLATLPVAIRRALEEQCLRVQRMQAIDALRRSEASYRSLIQSAPCGIMRFSAKDGRLLEGNAALAEMLGYDSSADLLQNGVVADIALDQEHLLRLTGAGEYRRKVIESEVEWRRKDGAPMVIGLRGRLLHDENGDPAYLEMIGENVTERRQAKERIRKLNRLYCVLSHSGQAIVRIREERELYREVCRILIDDGHFELAWIGLVERDTSMIKPVASYPSDVKRVTAWEAPVNRSPIGTAIRERRHVLCDDHRGRHSSAVFPILVGGRAIGAISIYARETGFFDIENVTLLDELAADLSFALERMELERMRHRAVDELDQFFALSLDMLCISNLDGYVHRLNPALEKTLGFSAADWSRKPWLEFVHPEDRGRALESWSAVHAGCEIEHIELRFLSSAGSYRWLIGSFAPALDRGVVFAALRDISERKYLEEQLRNQNLELEEQNRRANEASRLKSEFLANMSHELRSPLNGIIGFSELLYDGKLGAIPDRPREFVGRIHRSATHLLQLINSVLDLSKVEAGRLDFRPEPVSAPGVIEEVTGILGTLAAEKQIRVETEIDSCVEEVTIDAGRLKQILYNYLSNALKFTGLGGRVTVRLRACGAADFRIEVTDTGVGIAERDLPRLFAEFQQLDATAAKRFQGTGLGLALTKRIVEAQGGCVGVESKLGEGSTFFAVLPRVACEVT